jgi:hypothetical protein
MPCNLEDGFSPAVCLPDYPQKAVFVLPGRYGFTDFRPEQPSSGQFSREAPAERLF